MLTSSSATLPPKRTVTPRTSRSAMQRHLLEPDRPVQLFEVVLVPGSVDAPPLQRDVEHLVDGDPRPPRRPSGLSSPATIVATTGVASVNTTYGQLVMTSVMRRTYSPTRATTMPMSAGGLSSSGRKPSRMSCTAPFGLRPSPMPVRPGSRPTHRTAPGQSWTMSGRNGEERERTEERTADRADAADDREREHLQAAHEVEVAGLDRRQLHRVERTAEPGDPRRDARTRGAWCRAGSGRAWRTRPRCPSWRGVGGRAGRGG